MTMRGFRREESARGTILDTLAGVAGGLLGSMAIGTFMQKQQALPEKLRTPKMSGNPAEVVTRKAEEVLGTHVPEAQRGTVGQVLHFAYGTVGPTILGLVARRIGVNRSLGRTLAFGAGLGVVVWAVGYLGWLPRSNLVPPIQRQGATHVATSIASHAAYGILAALPLAASAKIG
jgi:hypothetical protein